MTKNHYGPVAVRNIEPMRMACYKAVSETPEEDSIGHMRRWLGEKDLIGARGVRVFGFDAEVTSEQQKAGLRGYEVWASIPKGVEPPKEMMLKDFSGGLFAVMRITDPFTNPFEVIPAGWKRLVGWAKANEEYKIVEGPCLEEHIESAEKACLDIYLPVGAKKARARP